eukprot:6199821-Pleurochrysis_carterae.AAC.5
MYTGCRNTALEQIKRGSKRTRVEKRATSSKESDDERGEGRNKVGTGWRRDSKWKADKQGGK